LYKSINHLKFFRDAGYNDFLVKIRVYFMFGRLFLILVLLAVSLYVVKYIRTKLDENQKRIDKESENGNDDSNKNNQNTKKLMVKCQQCGLHIPEKEAIIQGDNIFCSLEHAKREL